MSDKARFDVTVTVLSPLHVGSGERLREGFDFTARGGWLHVADQSRLMSALLDEMSQGRELLATARDLTGKTLYELEERGWLRDEHFDPARRLFAYRLQGRTSTTNKQGELHEQIKDVYRRPYLPGSTLKGALRTVIAWDAVRSRKLQVTADRLGAGRKFAAQPIERELFGRTPNLDLLRALQVGDSAPVDASALALATAHLAPAGEGRENLPIDLEAIRPGTVFSLQIGVDRYLLEDTRASRLRFGERASWLLQIATAGKRYSSRQVTDAVKHFQETNGPGEALRFYAGLVRLLVKEGQLAPDEFLLQIGWGAGWDSKTLDGELRRVPAEFDRIVDKYGLAEGPRRRGYGQALQRRPGDEFPATRKLATMPAARLTNLPMGWVKVKTQDHG
jgi:CRISPR-associated protein Csm5